MISRDELSKVCPTETNRCVLCGEIFHWRLGDPPHQCEAIGFSGVNHFENENKEVDEG